MSNINLSASGPPETILPNESPALDAALAAAGSDRDAVAAVVATDPTFLGGWATLGDLGRDTLESYAYYRIGYHRGLDKLRQNGWRGSGYVRWTHETNRGFLRSLAGLAAKAAEIGETDEALRCEHFLRQLDPAWPPAA